MSERITDEQEWFFSRGEQIIQEAQNKLSNGGLFATKDWEYLEFTEWYLNYSDNYDAIVTTLQQNLHCA